jgi:hypothetical protein
MRVSHAASFNSTFCSACPTQTFNTQLPSQTFERLAEMLHRGLIEAHTAGDNANSVVFMNMLQTFSQAASGEESGQLMSQHPAVLCNRLWRDDSFWDGVLWQMVATEREKVMEMFGVSLWSSLEESEQLEDASAVGENIAFAALSSILVWMLGFGASCQIFGRV